MTSNYLDDLNSEQREAVLHPSGPMVVFAGAGSGKTRAITTRIAHLIFNGTLPWKILAVTFTNKAANEMKERLRRLCPEGHQVAIGTFHAMCARWLREFAVELGYSPEFTIYDDSDSKSLLKKIMKEKWGDVDISGELIEVKAFIQRAKINGFLPQDVEQRLNTGAWSKIPTDYLIFYRAYQQALFKNQAMDFGDLILNMLVLLRTNKKVREILQNRYQHILVDEFQDTNRSQLELVRILAEVHRNIFVVGDDDQSIYSWRGAMPEHILEFDRYFPGSKKIIMNQNYRSAANIVQAANAVISRNLRRAEKKLFSNCPEGEPIDFYQESDGEMEAYQVATMIQQELTRYVYSDFAIFYRTNAQSRLLEEALRRDNIPYRIYGAVRFYDRQEIKDIIAYFRLIVNEDDDASFLRIINVPNRGLGQKSLSLIQDFAKNHDLTLMRAARQLAQQEQSRSAHLLSGFCEMIETLRVESMHLTLRQLLDRLLAMTNYKEYLKKKFKDQYIDKIENIMELSAALAQYEKSSWQKHDHIKDWLSVISLEKDGADIDEFEDAVSLMTLHAAKGLEFKRVFIVGVENGLIPHRSHLFEKDGLEEERRLFYVGMTRAKERLSFLAANSRMVMGNYCHNEPSQFLSEIPASLLRIDDKYLNSTNESYNYDLESDGVFIEEGQEVHHPTYGRGVVQSIEVRLGKEKAIIDFYEFGLRKVALSQLRPATWA